MRNKCKSFVLKPSIVPKLSNSSLQKDMPISKPKIQKIKHGLQTYDGVNADKIYERFFSNQVTNTIDIHRNSMYKQSNSEKHSDIPAIGTKKYYIMKRKSLEMNDKYSTAMSTEYNSISPKYEPKPFMNVFGNTVTSFPPVINKEVTANDSPKLNESGKFYNRSSVKYNIINYNNNPHSGFKHVDLEEPKIAHKIKGISEIIDQNDLFHVRHSTNILSQNADSDLFKRKIGIFTGFYDSAFRNGVLNIPFK